MRRLVWLVVVVALGCSKASGGGDGGQPDGGGQLDDGGQPDGDAAQDGITGSDGGPSDDRPASGCAIQGVYSPVQAQVVEGACTYSPATELSLRQLPDGPWALDFDESPWNPATVDGSTCAVTVRTGNWVFNNKTRQRVLTLSIAGDVLSGEMTDSFAGTDTFGGTCNVRYQLSARRTSATPPAGDPVGTDCGGLGCSGSRCAFGNHPSCASGICLFDSSVSPFDSICTSPCTDAQPCPTGFICLSVSQSIDTLAGRNYCARYRPICGNKTVDTGEECDDGNTTSGDGCSATCKREGCGNGVLDVGEQCDSAMTSPDFPCAASCTYTLPANVHVVAPPKQAGRLVGYVIAPLAAGNLLVSWVTGDVPQVGMRQLWVQRLTQQGASADTPVKLLEGTAVDTSMFALAASTGGTAVLIGTGTSTVPRAYVGAADGTSFREIMPFPATLMYSKMTVAASATHVAFFGQAWFPTDGHSAAVIMRAAFAGAVDPLIEAARMASPCYDGLSAEYAGTGDLAVAWNESCPTSSNKVATLAANASTVTTPVVIPAGPTGTSTGGPVLIRGASVPTVWTSHQISTPYEVVDVIVGRYAGGTWSWHNQALDIAVDERLSGFAEAPDGNLVAWDFRSSTTMQGQQELRFVRDVAGAFTFTAIQTTQVGTTNIAVDRSGTAHLLYNAPLVPAAGNNKMMHVQVSSAGQITGPNPVWAGGFFREFTAPDGDVYGVDPNRMLLVHLGP